MEQLGSGNSATGKENDGNVRVARKHVTFKRVVDYWIRKIVTFFDTELL